MKAAALVAAAALCVQGAVAEIPYQTLGKLLQQGLKPRVDAHKAKLASGNYKQVSINTKYGVVNGVAGNKTNQFLGVPYAAPPTGNLRWQPPQPVQPWGSLNATWWGPGCMQDEGVWTIYTGMSESCLYLNIYAPSVPSSDPNGYPVMFFMHGGSWQFGSGSFLLYDGDEDVTVAQDVIVVTINYRLGVFGFLAGAPLKAESKDGSVGNYGFQDQRAALQFVIDVISDFGGNPKMITMYGESAGGGSTSSHLVVPRSLGLFQRAIIESGAWSDWTAQPYNISATRFPTVQANVNCTSAPDALACMRAVDATAMQAADHHLTQGQLEWSPVIDGVELPDDPRNLLAQGKVAPVPIIMGFNMNEGTLFDKAPHDLNASEYLPAISSIIGPQLAPVIANAYPLSQYESPWWAISYILGDSQMACAAKKSAGLLTNPRVRNGNYPVYVYYYTHVLWIVEYIVDLFRPLGCFHGSELVNVFDLDVMLWGEGEADLARTFVSYWTNFAATGNPNGAGVPNWAQYGSTAQDYIAQIDITNGKPNVTMVYGLKASQCQLWNNITISPSIIWG